MNRRQLTFQTCTQGWCWCTPPPSERTTRRAALQPPGGGGDRGPLPRSPPLPPPPGQLIGSNTCASGSPGALSPEGAAGKALAVVDLGCLPPPTVPQRILPSGHADAGPRRGGGGGGIWPGGGLGRPVRGGGAGRGGTGSSGLRPRFAGFSEPVRERRKQATWHLTWHRGPSTFGIPRARSRGQGERAYVGSTSPTSGSSCALGQRL